ncbi:MAG: hypothetical protein Q7R80_00950 [bacterium]|nr:hypothetical protein [bacterium]
MDEEILSLIHDFLNDIQRGIGMFKSYYGFPPVMHEAKSRKMELRGANPEFEYAFHGVGICIEKGNWEIDFDYGDNLRTDGFDGWRIRRYWGSRKEKYPGVTSEDALVERFNRLIEEKKIAKMFPDDHLYYLQ